MISLIVAVSDNNAIGRKNELPWHLPADMKFFKRTTMGKPVVMGRKTYESLGRPLPGRLNIVISGSPNLHLPEGVLLYNNLDKAIERVQQEDVDEAFIIGGGKIFEIALPFIDRMYITRVHGNILDADVFFPAIDHTHWKLVWEEPHPADEHHLYAFTFQQFERTAL